MAKLSFQHHYSSLQCHIILQNQYNMPKFADQETFLNVENVVNVYFLFYFFGNRGILFCIILFFCIGGLVKRKFSRTVSFLVTIK